MYNLFHLVATTKEMPCIASKICPLLFGFKVLLVELDLFFFHSKGMFLVYTSEYACIPATMHGCHDQVGCMHLLLVCNCYCF